jgi:gliding motility-associated lipoprotein GldH
MKLHRLIAVIGVMLVSCSGDTVYKKFYSDFTEHQWQKTDIRVFEFSIDEKAEYDILLDFSHVYGFPFATVPIELVLEKPNKTVVSEKTEIIVSDRENGVLSDCSGDYCDLRQKLFSRTELRPGKYRLAVINAFDHPYLPNVLGLGIRVVRSGQ